MSKKAEYMKTHPFYGECSTRRGEKQEGTMGNSFHARLVEEWRDGVYAQYVDEKLILDAPVRGTNMTYGEFCLKNGLNWRTGKPFPRNPMTVYDLLNKISVATKFTEDGKPMLHTVTIICGGRGKLLELEVANVREKDDCLEIQAQEFRRKGE